LQLLHRTPASAANLMDDFGNQASVEKSDGDFFIESA